MLKGAAKKNLFIQVAWIPLGVKKHQENGWTIFYIKNTEKMTNFGKLNAKTQ